MKYFLYSRYNQILMTAATVTCMNLTACKKLIEIPPNPPNKISSERIYSNDKNALGALVGIYANFRAGSYLTSINGGTLSVYTGLSADELMPTFSTAAIDETFNNSMRTDNALAGEMWTTGYQGIYQVNAFLEGVTDNPNLSEDFKRQARGEALLTRALYYFNLVNIFGKVPLVKTTDYRINAVLPRSSADEIYAFITADLTASISLLTDTYPTAGRVRPNINAARALLARVYLYRKQWKEAADMAGKVIGAGIYELVEPKNVFIDGSKEAIWQILTLNLYGQTTEAATFVPYSSSDLPSYVITPDLEKAFAENSAGLTDKRSTQWLGKSTVSGVNYLYPAKYKSNDASAPPKEDYMIFRLGEQYLIRAEAFTQLNQLADAQSDINKIRARAGLANTTASSKEDLLAAIAKERRIELFAEWGNRWFDLKRTAKADQVLGPKKPNWQADDALYPVPLTERKTNPYLDQNPGYQ